MMPVVPVPKSVGIRIPVEVKLKRQFNYDPSRRVFESESGERFRPSGDLPKNTRIVPKVPALAAANPSKLSSSEKDLRRFIQVILPEGESAADYVDAIRAWPSVEDAWVGPEASLPNSPFMK
jgi:hypothetical protein